ncbi:hypothetical protein D3C74_188860 [compost metagenome]
MMRYISGAYSTFRIEESELDSVAIVWLDLLQDIPFELAREKTRMLCQENTQYHPKPAEIYQACLENHSFYELQRIEEQQEQLMLQEYYEQAVPMPQHIKEKLERRAARKVNVDER